MERSSLRHADAVPSHTLSAVGGTWHEVNRPCDTVCCRKQLADSNEISTLHTHYSLHLTFYLPTLNSYPPRIIHFICHPSHYMYHIDQHIPIHPNQHSNPTTRPTHPSIFILSLGFRKVPGHPGARLIMHVASDDVHSPLPASHSHLHPHPHTPRHTYIHTYIHTYTHIHSHTYIHTHTYAQGTTRYNTQVFSIPCNPVLSHLSHLTQSRLD